MLLKSIAIFVFAVTLHGADVSGKWLFHLIRAGEEFAPARVELHIEGEKLTGTLNERDLAGSARSDELDFIATRPNGDEFGRLQGKLTGAELRGTLKRGSDEMPFV